MQVRKFKKNSDFFGHGSIFQFNTLKFKTADGQTSKFENFYPAADITGGIKYAVICTQDCDLEQEKVSHINIALLEPVQRPKKANPIKFLDLKFDQLVVPFEDFNFYSISSLNQLKSKVDELIDNTSAQYLFVDIKGEYHFINLTKMFPMKFEHLAQLKSKVQFQLNGSFKHLLGWKLANLYGRVGVAVYPDSEKDFLSKNIIKIVGESVKNYLPKSSYELTDAQMDKLKPLLNNYKAALGRGKDTVKLAAQIYEQLAAEGIAKKTEKPA